MRILLIIWSLLFGCTVIIGIISLFHLIKLQLEFNKLQKENQYKQKWCKHKQKGYTYLPNGIKICKNCYKVIGCYTER